MKSYEMVETLSTKAGVSLEMAKDALERSNWDILDAAVYLERAKAGAAGQTQSEQQSAPQGGAYYVSGRLHENNGSFATPSADGDPAGFNRPYGYNEGYTPPYKDFPNRGAGGYYGSDQTSGYDFDDKPIGQAVGALAGTLEKIVNSLFCCYFVVNRRGSEVFRLHLLPTLIIGVVFWAATIPILLLGIAFECKYSIGIKRGGDKTLTDIIDETVNTAWDTAKRAKTDIVNETKNVAKVYEDSKREFAEDYRKGKQSVNLNKDK